MKGKTRFAIILGSVLSSTSLCAGVERFFFSPSQTRSSSVAASEPPPTVPQEQIVAKPSIAPASPPVPAPESATPRPSLALESLERERKPAEALPAEAPPAKTETLATDMTPAAPALPPTPAEPPVVDQLPSPQLPAAVVAPVAEQSPPEEPSIAQSPAISPPAAPIAPSEKPNPAPKTNLVEKTQIPEAAPAELLMQPKVGYGSRYYKFQQSGAFGGVQGSILALNVLSLDTMLRYEAWNLDVGLDQVSSRFAANTIDTTVNQNEAFRRFYFKPGYGIFFAGIEGKTAPLVRVSDTTLSWANTTTLSAVGGLRIEKWFDNRRRKPFLLGLEIEGSRLLSASGDGGAPNISSPTGYGVSFRGYAEKAIINREEFRLTFGLDGTAAYDKLQFNGAWSSSSGSVARSITVFGSKIYLGLDF